MKWSKLKSITEARFSPSVRGKVELWTTAYRIPNSTTGRGWITVEGEELVNFATLVSSRRFGAYYHESSSTDFLKHPAVKDNERTEGNVIEDGEFSRFDLHLACWDLISLSIENALQSENPLIRSLAVLDERCGKRRLDALADSTEHPLVAFFVQYRIAAADLTAR